MLIQVIDDSSINLKLLSSLLERSLGATVQTFEAAPRALEWSLIHDVDLIFVDYVMPEMDGLEFIEHFRAHAGKHDVPVVMVTSAEDRHILRRALELGANDFLNKPFDKFELLARTRNMLTIRKSHKELAARAETLAEEVRKATREIVEQEREVIFRLSRAAEYRSPETGLHVLRVAHYSRALARVAGLHETEQEIIFAASSMHDIGKVGTPDDILYKTDRLDEYEFAMIKLHTLTGYEIMQNSRSAVLQMAADIALCHHEKFDGTGYPRGIKGHAIPLSARICAIADVWDALTSERPYKKAWAPEEAIAELKRLSGSHFDPDLIDKFTSILPECENIRQRYSEVLIRAAS